MMIMNVLRSSDQSRPRVVGQGESWARSPKLGSHENNVQGTKHDVDADIVSHIDARGSFVGRCPHIQPQR